MKYAAPFLILAAGAMAFPRKPSKDVRDMPVTKEGSSLYLNGKKWKAVGANVYWLGLDENVTPPEGEPYYEPTKASYTTKGRITEIMATIRAMGGTMIRSHTLGASTGNPLSLMPTLGQMNEEYDAFEPIDWAVYQARVYGLRLMVPLTDNYDYYHGGKYDFLRWRGFDLSQSTDSNNPEIQQFYTNATIVTDFKDYIQKVVTHVNPYTNLSYAEDPTIFAYESGNELLGPIWGDMNCPRDWVQEIAQYVKELCPNKLFADGTYGVNATHLDIDEVDIVSDHFYPIDITKLQNDLDLVATSDKVYFAGEYDWTGLNGGSTSNGDDLKSWYKIIEESDIAIGDTFWSLFGRTEDCSSYVDHGDGFTMHYNDPRASESVLARQKLVRQHLVKMGQGQVIAPDAALPTVACPAPTAL